MKPFRIPGVSCRFASVAALTAGLLLSSARLPAQAADPALPPYRAATAVSGTLAGVTGMDTVEAMMGAWNEAFKRFHPGAAITITQKSVGPEERIALGPNTDEVFSPDNLAYENAYGCEPFRVRVCLATFALKSHLTAIGVFVNKDNPIAKLSLAELDAIYSAERRRGYPAAIVTWGQLGLTGEWADRPVHPYGFYWRQDVTRVFRELAMFDAPFTDRYRVPGTGRMRRTPPLAADLVKTLAEDRGGIVFGNFNFFQDDRLKPLALADRAGVVGLPVADDMANARYPLQRFLYLYVHRAPGQPLDPLAKEFLTFVLSRDGQELVGQDHYLPLPAVLAASERAKLE